VDALHDTDLPDRTDVVVVGAGLAGLACARGLRRRGLDVLVVDGAEAVGGRVRTDVVDGFRCDRGFQLLNPSYPAAKRLLDLDALDLQVFGRGVDVVQADGRTATLADPTRHPGRAGAVLRSGYLRPGDLAELARLGRWAAPALGPVHRLTDPAADDAPLAAALDRAGVDGRLRTEVLEPFLTGVLATSPATTSARFVRLLLRSFLLATPGVPAQGMQAMPDQLAASAVAAVAALALRTPSSAVRRTADGVEVDLAPAGAPAATVRARAAVVAAGPAAAAELVGDGLPAPRTRGLRTWWFAPAEAPARTTMLRVDGARLGPVVNTAVVSQAAPSYAPPGRHLVQATTLLGDGHDADEQQVRRHLARMWGPAAGADAWEVVTVHDVPEALPAMPPPLDVRRPVDLGDGLLVAGDHRDSASIQGALVSGSRAAAAAAARLGARVPA